MSNKVLICIVVAVMAIIAISVYFYRDNIKERFAGFGSKPTKDEASEKEEKQEPSKAIEASKKSPSSQAASDDYYDEIDNLITTIYIKQFNMV